MEEIVNKTIVVSACLFGVRCRWHGRKSYSRAAERILSTFGDDVRVVKVCPEMLGGLPCPRPPVKRKNGRVFETCELKANRKNVTGRELTKEFLDGAKAVLDICIKEGAKHCIFCSWSPSCGETGLTTKLLRENGIEVVNTF